MLNNNIVRKSLSEGINFTYIPEDKFKTSFISFSIFSPLDNKYVSANALLSSLLAHSCKKLPKLSDISKKLENLYGASIHPSVTKLGGSQVISLCATGLNSKYSLDDKNNILELTDILCDMIFDPDISNNKFNNIENFNQEKRQLIEDINSELNNKKAYAKKRCTEIMCADQKFSINSLGTVEQAENLTPEFVFQAWQKLLSESRIEIIITGSISCEQIINEFEKRFSKITRKNIVSCDTEIIKKSSDIKNHVEYMDLTQSKLVMGFRTEISVSDLDVYAMIVINCLYGGGAQSKLFLNVREKQSLCYYCSSKYNKHKAIILVESGVEHDNIDKAKQGILEQLKEIQIGNFTDSELQEIKLYISQSLKHTKDSLESLNTWYLSQVFSDTKETPDEVIEKINQVSREKIIEISNKISLDTVYVLTNNK